MESRIFSTSRFVSKPPEPSPYVQREKTQQEISWSQAASYFNLPNTGKSTEAAILDEAKRKAIKNIFKKSQLINGIVRDQLIERIVYM